MGITGKQMDYMDQFISFSSSYSKPMDFYAYYQSTIEKLNWNINASRVAPGVVCLGKGN